MGTKMIIASKQLNKFNVTNCLTCTAMTCHYEDEHSEDEVIQKYKYFGLPRRTLKCPPRNDM